METSKVKFETLKFKNQEIKEAMSLALNNGYRVFKSFFEQDQQQTYFTYSKNDKVAYLQADYSGVKISTIHKPCRDFGSGFGLYEDHFINTDLKDLELGFIHYPNWAKGDTSQIKKYNSLEEYFEYENKFRSNTVEIIK